VAVVTDAEAAAPTIAPVQVTPANDPLEYGGISKLSGLHDIADYMDVDVGPDGRVYAVFVDSCLAGCAPGGSSPQTEGIVAVEDVGGPTLI
jgi:hypothetical protein